MPVLEVPEILNFPDKLLPLITSFNDFMIFLAEGGRDSGKSHSVGRWLLYLAEQKQLRIVCGREEMAKVEESVYTLLSDLIRRYNLNFDIQAAKITHRLTGSVFNFRGFRDIGAENIKGIEGADIVWIDEAQTISKQTLSVLMPTIIRKDNVKIYFSMNRFIRNDPVFEYCVGRKDCLHIHVNYYDNKHCTDKAKEEAHICKAKDEAQYRHDWLGEPLDQTEDYLFNFAKLDITKTLQPFGELFVPQSVMGVDFSGAGGDQCVASLIVRRSNVHWELADQRAWSDKDTDLSVGKTIALRGIWNPTLLIVDKGGLGYPMFVSLSKVVRDVLGFDGAGESRQINAGNARADGYLTLKEFTDQEWLMLGKFAQTVKEAETIKRKYKANGKVYIQSKEDMRKDGVSSPDRLDSVMMAMYAVRYYLGKVSGFQNNPIQRINRRIDRARAN
jgi:phage terminase large subunit